MDDHETTSHRLASTDPSEEGVAQRNNTELEDKDIGWDEDAKPDIETFIGGMSNDEVWTLIRRFNKQMFHVKSLPDRPSTDLDLNIATEEEFTPDKLRARLEALYVTLAMSVFGVWKHMVRLRSWRERERTSILLLAYATAWILDHVVAAFLAGLVLLILVPRARVIIFPPAPAALVDARTGGVQKPMAGVLASVDSMTGAPEKHSGEAIEQEAHSFVNSICMLAASLASGSSPEIIATIKDKTGGSLSATEPDKTKKPIEDAVWEMARPVMHRAAHIIAAVERLGNALSPAAPFPKAKPRLRLAACVVPALLGSFFITPYVLMKGLELLIGLAIFGDPLLKQAGELVNQWTDDIHLRSTLLKGIPTNSQLALTLLRVGERNRAPLPPPPSTHTPPEMKGHPTVGQALGHLGAAQDEIDDAIRPDERTIAEADGDEKEEKTKSPDRLLALGKGAAKRVAKLALGADRVMAHAGSDKAKDRLGAVKSRRTIPTGPSRFLARFDGKAGHVYIAATATAPILGWSSDSEDVNPAWTIAIADIHEIQKTGGLGWKSKIAVSWATDREIVDGLVIRNGQGDEHHLTALVMRDELFNRLVAIGGHIWESW